MGKTAKSAFSLHEATVGDIHAAYRERQLSARELVQLYINRIDSPGPGRARYQLDHLPAWHSSGRLSLKLAPDNLSNLLEPLPSIALAF